MTATLTLVRPGLLTQREAAREAELAVRARRRLLAYAQYMWRDYQSPPHLERLAEALEAVERGELDRLIVMMPPRHGKSLLVSRYFPAWYLARHPERYVICATYGAELAHSFGRESRNVFADARTKELFPCAELRADSHAAHRWHTTAGGGLIASGIPGPIVGRGAHLLSIDDPIRGRDQADSEIERERVWQWWQADARTRLEPGAAVVLTYTPWHQDDLGGRLLNSEDAARWRVIRMPALDATGAPLWPERFDAEALEQTRRDVGPREWSALYMLEPVPTEGLIFRWWPRYRESELPADPQQVLLAIDTAYTTGPGSDYTAAAAWAVAGRNAYLIGARRWRLEAPRAERELFLWWAEIAGKFSCSVTPLVRRRVAIDRVVGQHLRERRIPVVEVDLPAGARLPALAATVSAYFEAGLARIPEQLDHQLAEWWAEHQAFPTGAHDDWVETTVLALSYYRRLPPPQLPNVRVKMSF